MESLATVVIDGMDTPATSSAAWRILTALKVVDPTCGSGRLPVRRPQDPAGPLRRRPRHSPRSGRHLIRSRLAAALLAEVDAHPNQTYFILKHATLNNIYGVDLMKEATEIARLRLFLKLVSAIDDRKDLEPLPDLDFNIKSGNVLVGAHTVEEIRDTTDLFAEQPSRTFWRRPTRSALPTGKFREVQESGDRQRVKAARDALLGPPSRRARDRQRALPLRRTTFVDRCDDMGRRPTSPSTGSSSTRGLRRRGFES